MPCGKMFYGNKSGMLYTREWDAEKILGKDEIAYVIPHLASGRAKDLAAPCIHT